MGRGGTIGASEVAVVEIGGFDPLRTRSPRRFTKFFLAEGASLEAEGASLEAEGAFLEAEGASLEAEGAFLEAEGASLEAEGVSLEAEGVYCPCSFLSVTHLASRTGRNTDIFKRK
jgi:hypothetical protein